MKRALIVTIAVLSVFSKSFSQKSAIFAPEGNALKGYDVVAFFTEGKAVQGSGTHSYQWNGVNWFFSSKANLESFKKSPEKYAPQYGGYCAYGAAEGHKAPTQADTWTIIDNKLYFNYNLKTKESWSKNRTALIDSANRKWPDLKDME